MNVLQWADFYAKVPTAVSSGNGPDLAIMHIDQLATNAARRVIIPVDEIATVLEYQEDDFAPAVWQAGVYKEQRYGIPLDVHPLLFYYNQADLQKAGLSEPPKDKAELRGGAQGHEGQGGPGPVLGDLDLAGPPDVVVADLPVRRGALQRRRLPGPVQLRGRRPGPDLDDQPDPDLQPQERGRRRPGDRLPAGQERPHLGRHLDDERVGQGQGPGVGRGSELPQIGSQPAVWGSSHNFVVTTQAQKDPNKLQASKVFIACISDHSIDWAKAGQIAARASVRESPEFQALETQSTAAQQLDYVKFPPAVPGIGEVTAPTFELAVNEAVLGKKSPKAALDEATKKANELLAANKKKYGG